MKQSASVKMTHDELIRLGRDWLIKPYCAMADYGHSGCGVVITEIKTATPEQPDVIGFSGHKSIVIECKASRSDFLADLYKPFRIFPAAGVGEQRWYLAPPGVITVNDIKPEWGLLEVKNGKTVTVIKKAELQKHNQDAEILMLISLLRRLEIQPVGHVAIKKYEILSGINKATFYIDKRQEKEKWNPRTTKELYRYVGHKISEVRKEKGLRQEELAQRMGFVDIPLHFMKPGELEYLFQCFIT